MDHAIVVEGLIKRFGQRVALNGIDLEIDRGSVFGVRPTAGMARVLGTDYCRAGRDVRRRIGYLAGELELERRTTGRRMMSHFAAVSGPVRPGRVDELAAGLGLELDRQSRKPSKGNKQKLGLVQAFMHDPELLVLDEPTSGLDPLMQREFLGMVEDARRRGQIVFLSSHMIGEIQQAADRVAILRDGRIDDGASALDAAYAGDIGALLHALSGWTCGDLVLEEPDLEEAELALYGSEPGNGRHRTEGAR